VTADGGVKETAALRRPGQTDEIEVVFKQQRDVFAGADTKRAERLGAAVRQRVEFGIGQCLATSGHAVGDLVRLRLRKSRWMFHGVSSQCALPCLRPSALLPQAKAASDDFLHDFR
jgi:hypothetical protein